MNQNQNNPRQNKPCFNFIKSGTCKFGEKCNFSHTVPANTLLRQKNNLDQINKKPFQKPSPSNICRFFLKGTCNKGETCRFSHSSDQQPPQNTQSYQKPQNTQNYQKPQNTQNYQKPYNQQTTQNYQKPYNQQTNQNYQKPYNNQNYQKPYNQQPNQNYQKAYNSNRGYNGGYVRDYKNEKPEASFKELRHVYTNDEVYCLNNTRRANNLKTDFKIPELLFDKCVVCDDKIIVLIKGKNFVLEFDMGKREFGKRQKFVNSEIDESILDIKIGKFGNIDSEFSAIAYTKFNELNLTMSSGVMITPKMFLLNQNQFLDLEITTVGPIENLHMSSEFLFNSYIITDGNNNFINTIYNIYNLSSISQYLSNLEELKKFIQTTKIQKEINQQITVVKSQNKLLVLGFADGKISFNDFQSQKAKNMDNVHTTVF